MPNFDLYNAGDPELDAFFAKMHGHPAGVVCGGMVVNVNTGQIGWIIWPEDDAVVVEISFGTGRHEWAVDRWAYADVVVPGSHSSPSRAVSSGTPAAAAREATAPAAPAVLGERGDAGAAGTDRPAPGAGLRPGAGRFTSGGAS